MRNGGIRLARLEQSVRQAKKASDWTETRAYAQMQEGDRARLHAYTERYVAEGLTGFTDDQLHDFEILVFPFAKEEDADGEQGN